MGKSTTTVQLLSCNCGDCKHWEIGKSFLKCVTCGKIVEATFVLSNELEKEGLKFQDHEI